MCGLEAPSTMMWCAMEGRAGIYIYIYVYKYIYIYRMWMCVTRAKVSHTLWVLR